MSLENGGGEVGKACKKEEEEEHLVKLVDEGT